MSILVHCHKSSLPLGTFCLQHVKMKNRHYSNPSKNWAMALILFPLMGRGEFDLGDIAACFVVVGDGNVGVFGEANLVAKGEWKSDSIGDRNDT